MNSTQFARPVIYKSLRVRPEQDFARFELERLVSDEGDIFLRNLQPAPDQDQDVLERFDRWATMTPDTCFVGQLLNPQDSVSYGEAKEQADRLAQELIDRGLTKGSVLATLVDASCQLAVLKLACLRCGVVHVPIAEANLGSPLGRKKIDAMLGISKPKLVIVATKDQPALEISGAAVPTLAMGALFDAALKRSDPLPKWPGHASDDHAAIYFTSGSTGVPKGVLITRKMISAVQSRVAAHWPFLTETQPVMTDWLPWHHVFGGLDNFFKMVWNGGSYYFRPVPRRQNIAEMAEKIAALGPTVYTDVPFGLSLLLDQFEERPDLLDAFQRRVKLIFFAGAGMDGDTWKKLNRLLPGSADSASAASPLRLTSGYGSTESGSTICLGHERPASPGEIGIPLPDTELRLVETDDRLELRVRGPHVSPGYLGPDGHIPMPLDEQGFLMTGDTVAPLRSGRPETGMVFDGRLAEDFKLTNGTRVKVGALRQLLLSACSPFLADVAIAGESKQHIGVLLFPTPEASDQSDDEMLRVFERALSEHNVRWPGSSMAVRRAIIASEPINASEGEINDKGHLVQRQTLKRRAAEVRRLFATTPDAGVLVPSDPAD